VEHALLLAVPYGNILTTHTFDLVLTQNVKSVISIAQIQDRTACYAHLDRRWDRKLGRPNPRRNRTLDSRRELPWELFLCIKLVKLE